MTIPCSCGGIYLANFNCSLFLYTRQSYLCSYAEFFMQGDEEQHLGLPLSSNLVDRNNIDNIPSLQTGFQQHIAIPAFDLLSKIFPSCSYLLEAVHANCKRWSDLGAK